jgi:hypothetical protein
LDEAAADVVFGNEVREVGEVVDSSRDAQIVDRGAVLEPGKVEGGGGVDGLAAPIKKPEAIDAVLAAAATAACGCVKGEREEDSDESGGRGDGKRKNRVEKTTDSKHTHTHM